ncbi:Uncharacterised protein [Chlamydia trachomatis]|nr:Uncharacterised protein [Chlamydia trachomatis]
MYIKESEGFIMLSFLRCVAKPGICAIAARLASFAANTLSLLTSSYCPRLRFFHPKFGDANKIDPSITTPGKANAPPSIMYPNSLAFVSLSSTILFRLSKTSLAVSCSISQSTHCSSITSPFISTAAKP